MDTSKYADFICKSLSKFKTLLVLKVLFDVTFYWLSRESKQRLGLILV